jgi:ubiquinone/menaquinone biosynthesis C-methylase UbiE
VGLCPVPVNFSVVGAYFLPQKNSPLNMNKLNELKDVVTENHPVRLVEDDIYSVLPETSSKHHYDRRATIYDLIVSTRLYNFVMWGSSPLEYKAFARQAIVSGFNGRFLDAACGSMLFTAPTYLECNQQIIAFDQSLAMLRRARKRLINLSGSMPEHVLLLQADLSDLPFRPAGFRTVLCMNVLHHFENATALLPNLKRLLTDDGHLYLTSLVSSNRFVGDRYLNSLYAAGEFVRPRSYLEFKEMLDRSLNQEVSYRVKGNMAFASTAGLP